MTSRQPEPIWGDELTRLIQLGRDREAAELAARHLAPQIQGDPMDPRIQLDQIIPLLKDLVAPLNATQLDTGTPCATFTVRGVLEHMVDGATMFAAAFRGTTPAQQPQGADLLAAFPTAMDGLREAVHSPGALDRTIAAPFGDIPAEDFARFVVLDGLVHGWDIATATGQPFTPPGPVVAEVDAFAHQAISKDMRGNGMFAAPVEPPADASLLVQLVAFTGRDV